jgi:choline kinase
MVGSTGHRPLEAVVLAAGLGSRLGEPSVRRHKSLSCVGGRPILGRTLDSLVAADVAAATIVVGHLGEQVRDFARQWSSRLPLRFVENAQAAATGTAYSLVLGLGEAAVGHNVLVAEADVVFSEEALARLLSCPHADATLVAPFSPNVTGSAVVCGADRVIRDWVHARHQPPDFRREDAFKTVNLTLLARHTASLIRPWLRHYAARHPLAPLECAWRELVGARGLVVHAVDVRDAVWWEVDTQDDLRLADRLFATPFQPAR